MKITIIINVDRIIIIMLIILFSRIMLSDLVEMYPALGSDIMKFNVYGIIIQKEEKKH
jgi:hypothetical protein